MGKLMTQQRLTEEQCESKTYFCKTCNEWKFDQPIKQRYDTIHPGSMEVLSGWVGVILRCTTCHAEVGRIVEAMS